MNHSQKVTLIAGAALVLLSYLFPFWQVNVPWDNGRWATVDNMAGPRFIGDPPKVVMDDFTYVVPTVNYQQMSFQVVILLILTVGTCLILRDKPHASPD